LSNAFNRFNGEKRNLTDLLNIHLIQSEEKTDMPNDLPLTFDDIEVDNAYNGWTNYETWNVALWIGGDQGLYNFAKEFASYDDFVVNIKEVNGDSSIGYQTPDGVAWNDSGLNHSELDEFIKEL